MGFGVGFMLFVLVALVGYGLWVGECILLCDDVILWVSAMGCQWGWEFT